MQLSTASAWIALQRTPGISSQSLRRLLLSGYSPGQLARLPSAALDTLPLSADARRALATFPNPQLVARADRDCDLLAALGARLVALTDADYPPLLAQTADPPALLYVRGDVTCLHWPQVAIVGSRRCSRQGRENAFQMGRGLAQAGLAVTSGGALGIDSASHEGALAEPQGMTVAVLGTGIDVVYPRRNRALFEQLQCRGALVSEFPPGTQPHRALFPQRNRLISGLSVGVLVVEAALRSGSLITARYALEQNRDVYAIPGSIHSPGSEGCNSLIRQGAQLVTAPGDIVEALHAWLPSDQRHLFSGVFEKVSTRFEEPLEAPERKLLEQMGFDPVAFETLLPCLGGDVGALQSLLTGLEIKGLIEPVAGGYQRLVKAGTE